MAAALLDADSGAVGTTVLVVVAGPAALTVACGAPAMQLAGAQGGVEAPAAAADADRGPPSV
jgi:hypothetical protein